MKKADIGLIGLAVMGENLVMNMESKGFTVAVFNRTTSKVDHFTEGRAAGKNVIGTHSLEELVDNLESPRKVMMMIKAGGSVDSMIDQLLPLLSDGDIIIDGGNSNYKDSVSNYQHLAEKSIHFYDCGTSGGMNGALNGGNFMIGGEEENFPYIEPIFKKIAEENGYLFTGEPGSGHYLKMVHNGIEYGMMQAIAEGFDLLEHSPYRYDNEKVARLWNNGSVIRSWLMDLMAQAFSKDPHLSNLKGVMYSSGEGRWTIEEALERQVPMPVIGAALMMRYRSLEEDTFTGKVVASLRNEFGGHAVKK